MTLFSGKGIESRNFAGLPVELAAKNR